MTECLKSPKKNLEVVDFTNKRDRIDSPRSIKAIKMLGIEENNLYYINKEDFLNSNPVYKSMSVEMKDKHFYKQEETRQIRIERAKKIRDKLIFQESQKIEGSFNENYNRGNNLNLNNMKWKKEINLSNSLNNSNSQAGKFLKGSKSSINFWEDKKRNIDKEQELLFLLQKQNLSEVKNLIEFNLKLIARDKENKAKVKKEEQREEKLTIIKNRERAEKQKIKLKKEKVELEQVEKERKLNEKKIRDYHIEQIKKGKALKEKELLQEKRILERQIEWTKQNEEYKKKLNELNLHKMRLVQEEYKQILKKDGERMLRLAKKKQEFVDKFKQSNEKYDDKIKQIIDKKEKLRYKKVEQLQKKQKQIQEFAEIQKEVRAYNIKNLQNTRIEKQIKNINIRRMNEQRSEEKRQELIKQLEQYDNKVNQFKQTSTKAWENLKYENLLRKNTHSLNVIENNNRTVYNNMIKINEMNDKEKSLQKRLKMRENSAKSKREIEIVLQDKKQSMLRKVKTLFSKENNMSRDEIYNLVFTPDEIDLLLCETNTNKNNNKNSDNRKSRSNETSNPEEKENDNIQIKKFGATSNPSLGFNSPRSYKLYNGYKDFQGAKNRIIYKDYQSSHSHRYNNKNVLNFNQDLGNFH